MRRTTILAVTTAAALAIAACGGSSSSKGDGGGSTSTTSASSGSGGAAFSDLAEQAKDANVKATYTSGSSDDEFTIAQYEGDSYLAFGNDAFYSVGGKSYTCEGSGSEAQCFELPGNADLSQSIVQSFFGAYAGIFDGLQDSSSAFGSVRTTTKSTRIAGRDAQCATVSASALGQSGSVSVCLDEETGFLLRAGTSGGGDGRIIEATAFDDSTAADVAQPAEPQSLLGQ